MKRTIFYSWQSDLPKNTNLNFIEKCLNDALKKLKTLEPISIELALDKATREVPGSPDITESIFTKINKCSVFLADISIISSSSKNVRKTPNPNVLLELGYAARVLGWEKIICIYNTDYGSFDDLPFDLRNRRIMTYSFKKAKRDILKKEVATKIAKAIQKMAAKGILTDKILDFLKKEIDQEILGLISHFVRFINKSDTSSNFFENIQNFLNFSSDDILKLLKNKKVLGFYLLKSFHEYEKKIYNFITQAISSQYYKREILNSLIDIYEWFSAYSNMWTKYSSYLFIKLDEKENTLSVIHSSEISPDDKLNNRYLLVEKIDKDKGKILNFGDFYPGHLPNLTYYYKFNTDHLDKYIDTIMLLIRNINNWLNLTNDEIIIDFVKNFRIKKVNGDWL